MTSFPWITAMAVVPALGALLLWAVKGLASKAREVALGVSLVTLALGIGAATQFRTGDPARFQLAEQHSWIPQFGVSYAVGVDGIALVLILMSLILVPICILAAWRDLPAEQEGRQRHYMALMLILTTFIVLVFAATDVFLFYVVFEAMLIPVYFLIGQFGPHGGKQRGYAAMKFLLFSLAGGLIMLAAVIALYTQGPGGADGFLLTKLTGLQIAPNTERLLFLGFFLAFAVKAPMVPVHTWLPDAAAEARPATSTLLVGVLDKVGTYGMIRFCLELFPEASKWATPVVLGLALVSIVYGAMLAIGQSDIMRLVAFTSISHFGFIVMGIFALTQTGWIGSTLYMVNHGFSTAALFLVAGMLMRRQAAYGGGDARESRAAQLIDSYGGWQRVVPVLAGAWLVAGLSCIALPGLGSFVSEFLVLAGTFQRYQVLAVIAATGIILAAIYILRLYQRTMTGVRPEGMTGARDATGREKWVIAPLIALFLILGFYPKPALDLITPSVERVLNSVQVTDPAPAGRSAK